METETRALHMRVLALAAVFVIAIVACGDNGAATTTTQAEEPSPTEPPATEPPPTTTPEGGTIAFSHPYTANPIRIAVVEFAQERAAQLGYELLLEESNQQVDRQIAAIEAWITQSAPSAQVAKVALGA